MFPTLKLSCRKVKKKYQPKNVLSTDFILLGLLILFLINNPMNNILIDATDMLIEFKVCRRKGMMVEILFGVSVKRTLCK